MTAYLVIVTNDLTPSGPAVYRVEAESPKDAQVEAVHRAFRGLGWACCTASAAVPTEIVSIEEERV